MISQAFIAGELRVNSRHRQSGVTHTAFYWQLKRPCSIFSA
jgi:hypothetical protein